MATKGSGWWTRQQASAAYGNQYRSIAGSSGSTSTTQYNTNQNMPKYFDILPFPCIRCRVHPVVIFTILDAYIRREEDQQYVIGTLMGIVSEGNILEITDCFVDRHSLTDEGLLQIIKDHHESMYELKQKINPKEQVVGWFCTGCEMTELTCAVHGWFKQFSSVSKFNPQPPLIEPVHLMVDTTLEKASLTIKAFFQAPLHIVKDSCFHFHEIPLEIYTPQADKGGISMLLKARDAARKVEKGNEVFPLKDGFEAALDRLLDLLITCRDYVSDVLLNNIKPDAEIGRYLSKALCGEAALDPVQFNTICQNALQDNLMVAYLASAANVQFALAEKLNTSFF